MRRFRIGNLSARRAVQAAMGTKPARTLCAGLATVAMAAAASAGCGASDRERESGGTTGYPRGSEDVVLRVEEAGSYAPLVWQLRERVPLFALYGDGRTIAQVGESPVEPPRAVPPLVERRLTREGIEGIVSAARRAGLDGPDRRYENIEVTELPTTTFTLVSEGETHLATAYGLVELENGEGVPAGEREARSKLLELRSALLDLDRWLPDAATGPARPYRYEALLVFVIPHLGDVEVVEDAGEGDTPPEAEWPLAVDLAEFGEPLANMPDVRCGLIEGSELERLRGPAGGTGVYARWRSGKTVRLLAFRPLLPGDPDTCGPP